MDIAFHANHDFRLCEFARQEERRPPLAMIPLPVDLCHWMNIVCDRVGILDLQNLIGLNAENAGCKPAAVLVNYYGRSWRFKPLPFQTSFDIDECVRQRSIGRNNQGVVQSLSMVSFHASWIFAHVDLCFVQELLPR